MGTTTQHTELLGREGETKSEMLDWFRDRGFWQSPTDKSFVVLNQLNAMQLDLLAGQVTHYGLKQFREGEQTERAKHSHHGHHLRRDGRS